MRYQVLLHSRDDPSRFTESISYDTWDSVRLKLLGFIAEHHVMKAGGVAACSKRYEAKKEAILQGVKFRRRHPR